MVKILITNRANKDLQNIALYSYEKWGEKRADLYMSDFLKNIREIAKNPSIGKLRQHRSEPFLMANTGEHFIIYEEIEDGIVVATILHGKQNIELIIKSMKDALIREVEKKRKTGRHIA